MAKKPVYIDIKALEEDDEAVIKYVDSDRSDGKTTHCIRLVYEEFKRTGKAGVILRRDCGEVTDMYANELCVDLLKVHPECGELTHKGSPKKNGIVIMEDGVTMARIVPLTRAGKLKSAISYDTHRNLYYDEFVPLNGRYLPNEMTAIFELHQTIDRRHDDTVIWIFSNHLTATNPVFRYFGIQPRNGISRWKEGRFILLRCANKGNRAALDGSKFGELVRGTAYGAYATQGEAADNAAAVIHAAHLRARHDFILRGRNGDFGLYYSDVGLVLDYATQRPAESVFCSYPNDGTGGAVFLGMPAVKPLRDMLRNRFYTATIFCASQRVFEDAQDLWRLLGAK